MFRFGFFFIIRQFLYCVRTFRGIFCRCGSLFALAFRLGFGLGGRTGLVRCSFCYRDLDFGFEQLVFLEFLLNFGHNLLVSYPICSPYGFIQVRTVRPEVVFVMKSTFWWLPLVLGLPLWLAVFSRAVRSWTPLKLWCGWC